MTPEQITSRSKLEMMDSAVRLGVLSDHQLSCLIEDSAGDAETIFDALDEMTELSEWSRIRNAFEWAMEYGMEYGNDPNLYPEVARLMIRVLTRNGISCPFELSK